MKPLNYVIIQSKMSEGYLLNELKKCDLQLKNYILFELPET